MEKLDPVERRRTGSSLHNLDPVLLFKTDFRRKEQVELETEQFWDELDIKQKNWEGLLFRGRWRGTCRS